MRKLSCLIMLLGSCLFYGCNENVENGNICGLLPLDGREDDEYVLAAEAINGEEMPYYSVYIDEENYSEIYRVQLTVYKDGTWESHIWFTEEVEGDINNDVVDRKGEYACTAAGIALEEEDGGDAGILSENTNPNVDADWVLLAGSNEYYF